MKTLIATTFAAALLVSGAAVAETVGALPEVGLVTAGASVGGAAAPAAGYHSEIGDLAQFAPAETDGREVVVLIGGASGFTGSHAQEAGVAGDAASGAERVLR